MNSIIPDSDAGQTADALVLPAPAKINVFLEVAGKRDDGFHELETVMLRTSLSDTLFVRPASSGISLSLHPDSEPAAAADFPLGESNLIVRAARLLQQTTGCLSGAEICVLKRIPAEAGLAGGSSNAATALRALNQIWQLNCDKPRLHTLAAKLGSDINFFVEDCRAAVCRGRGEQVEPISLAHPVHLVAARRPQGNSTPDVFRRTTIPAPAERQLMAPIRQALTVGDNQAIAEHTFNRLTAAAAAGNASMRHLLALMAAELGVPAHMSGSGSTCFCYAADAEQAEQYAAQLRSHEVPFVCVLKC